MHTFNHMHDSDTSTHRDVCTQGTPRKRTPGAWRTLTYTCARTRAHTHAHAGHAEYPATQRCSSSAQFRLAL